MSDILPFSSLQAENMNATYFCLATLPFKFQLRQVGRLHGQLSLSPVGFHVRLNYPSLYYMGV